MCLFFFSSRRRHTRFSRDWSSDVCSSDLGGSVSISSAFTVNKHVAEVYHAWRHLESLPLFMEHLDSVRQITDNVSEWKAKVRSEERRVGKECRCRCAWYRCRGKSRVDRRR